MQIYLILTSYNWLLHTWHYLVPRNAVTLENCHRGLEVQRGRDWYYGAQDHAWWLETLLHPESYYHPYYGTIQNCRTNEWADVRWDKANHSYPIGAEGIYALNIRKGIYCTTRFDGAVSLQLEDKSFYLVSFHFRSSYIGWKSTYRSRRYDGCLFALSYRIYGCCCYGIDTPIIFLLSFGI